KGSKAWPAIVPVNSELVWVVIWIWKNGRPCFTSFAAIVPFNSELVWVVIWIWKNGRPCFTSFAAILSWVPFKFGIGVGCHLHLEKWQAMLYFLCSSFQLCTV